MLLYAATQDSEVGTVTTKKNRYHISHTGGQLSSDQDPEPVHPVSKMLTAECRTRAIRRIREGANSQEKYHHDAEHLSKEPTV